MAHVFISYSTRNDAYARALAEKLRAEGFDVWIDQRRLHSSEDWWRAIVLALRASAAFVVILTPEADQSRWVQREITLAEKYGKPMFPLLLDGDLDTPNWELFVRIQVEDVRGGSLPPPTFYDYLAQYAPRQARPGANVTALAAEAPDDDEVRAEIADVPAAADVPLDTEARRDMGTPPEPTQPNLPSPRPRRLPLLGLAMLGLTLLAVIIAALVNGARQPESDQPDAVAAASSATRTATLSPTEYELTVQGEIALMETEGAGTRAAALAATAANITAAFGGTADSLTGTAAAWTPTPTPDARQTAQARLTLTQAAVATEVVMEEAAATEVVAVATAPLVPTPFGGGSGELLVIASGRVYRVDVVTGNSENILSELTDVVAARWSPDGDTLAVQHGTRLAIVDGSTYELLQTSEGAEPAVPGSLTWLANSRDVLYVRGGALRIYDIDANEIALSLDMEADLYDPDVSPDGTRLAVTTYVPPISQASTSSSITLFDINGSNAFTLTGNERNAYAPDWSPDGASIVFVGYDPGSTTGMDLFTLRTDGSDLRQLTSTGAAELLPVYSPDGTRIAFIRDGEAYTIRLDGTDEQRLPLLLGDIASIRWRPQPLSGAPPIVGPTEEATMEATEALLTPEATAEVTAEATAEATEAANDWEYEAVILGATAINVRTGPGTTYSVWTTAAPGTALEIKGRSADGAWLWIGEPFTDYGDLWVSASVLRFTRGSLGDVPVINR